MTLLEFQLTPFLGRFHPLLVHLPIGFLIIAMLMEYISKKKSIKMNFGISLSFLAGAISAILAVILGLMLANAGGYDDSTLFWHKWIGICVAVVSIVCWLIKSERLNLSTKTYSMLLIALFVTIAVTGHLGGNLTHGANYLLEYAPQPIAKILGGSSVNKLHGALSNPDSALVYADIIQPLFNKNCIECHSDSKKKGDLNLQSANALMKGGESGNVIVAGNAFDSELFRRVRLSPDHEDFMPSQGKKPFNFNEISILKWWIDAGADFELPLRDAQLSGSIEFALVQTYGLGEPKEKYIDQVEVSSLSEGNFNKLRSAGFYADLIMEGSNLIEIRKNPNAKISSESLSLLNNAKEQITWINLGDSDIKDNDLKVLGKLKNLTVLSLEKNAITDKGVEALKGLKHLEVLNLYGTAITVGAIESLKELTSLKKLYLWQTEVKTSDLTELKKAIPYLEIDIGVYN